MNEQKLKEELAQQLLNLGCEVYIDRGNNFPKFKGKKNLKSLKKPDLIVFSQSNGFVTSPWGVELKLGDSYGIHINQVIEQMRNYKMEPLYLIGNKSYSLKNLFLATKYSIQEDILYNGSSSFPFTQTEESKKSIEWAIIRQLFSLTTASKEKLYFGILKKDSIGFYMMFPNFLYRLSNGGKITKEWIWHG